MKLFLIIPFLLASVSSFQSNTQLVQCMLCKTSRVAQHPALSTQLFTNSAINHHDQFCRRRLSSSSINMSNSDADDANSKKIAGRKKRVIYGYGMITIGYLLPSIAALFQQGLSIAYLIGGPVLASGISYILSGAAKNDRLNSDTYKRLNLFLAEYGLCGLITTAIMRSRKPFIIGFVSYVTLVNSIKGWGYGVKGWDLQKTNIVKEIVTGAKDSIKGLFSIKNPKGAVYLAATITVGIMKLLKLTEIIGLIATKASAEMVSSRVLRLGKLALLTAVVYTLKDAADRDRLEGTTFIELNYLSSAVFASMAAYMNQISQNVLGATALSFSLFSLINALISVKKKSNKKSS